MFVSQWTREGASILINASVRTTLLTFMTCKALKPKIFSLYRVRIRAGAPNKLGESKILKK